MKHLQEWKKVYESDLSNIVSELKESVDKPAIIILSGEVGSGKTTLTKHFCDIGEVSSPTYSLINEIGRLAHADFYRIEDEKDLMHLEIPLYLENKDYFLVEWGMPYIDHLKRESPEDFSFYEFVISINDPASTDGQSPSRNYHLYEILG
ncbi:MAG: tRNA (adenosine(37)-N6)-threonylcarbamoyltransferase complex ATPase subunit type 1 TsaE [Bacteriovoracaceae bacterium]|nr:tRNA (adenosine(37)-N6)-threonylcarbamoyltransferase complex ATPase subunit type 1 TsaE [Bacteriovoracaceae bacterium]